MSSQVFGSSTLKINLSNNFKKITFIVKNYLMGLNFKRFFLSIEQNKKCAKIGALIYFLQPFLQIYMLKLLRNFEIRKTNFFKNSKSDAKKKDRKKKF